MDDHRASSSNKKRDKLFKTWMQSPENLILKSTYANFCNELNRTIIKHKHLFYFKELNLDKWNIKCT